MKIRIGVNLTRCNRSLIFVLLILSCKDNPTTPDVTALQITADTFTTFSGGTIQLTAVATLPDGTTSDVTTEAAWSVSPGQAGSIDQNGLFTAFNHVTGIETVEARHRSQTATAQIEVTKRASTFSISPALTNVESGRTIQFRAFATFQDGSGEFVTDQVAWSVIPGTAVEIDDKGLLTALPGMTGTETVSAEFHTLTAQSKVEVQVVYQNRFQMVEIAAGSFLMGDNDGFSDQQPEHEVFIDAFEIGKYEITNAQYAEYLNQASARGDVFLDTGSGVIFGRNGPFHNQYYIKITGGFSSPEEFIVFDPVEGEFFPQSGFEQFPVTRLTWYGAAAFCDFYGLRLPTEAEWEKACRGGQQLEFGTQDGTLTHDLANFAGTGGRDTYQGAAPVGSFPPNPFGLFDMCANAAEHVFDLYDPDYYQNSPNENPKGPGPPMPVGRLDFITVIRGGGGNSSSIFCRSAFRGVFDNLPDLEVLSGTLSGFRVARSLP